MSGAPESGNFKNGSAVQAGRLAMRLNLGLVLYLFFIMVSFGLLVLV